MNNSVNDSQIQYRTLAERHIPKRKVRYKIAPAERHIPSAPAEHDIFYKEETKNASLFIISSCR